MTTAVKYPAKTIEWRSVVSSNVKRVGWDGKAGMYVEYLNGSVYLYHDVPVQRVQACLRSLSVGGYIARSIKPRYDCTKIAEAA